MGGVSAKVNPVAEGLLPDASGDARAAIVVHGTKLPIAKPTPWAPIQGQALVIAFFAVLNLWLAVVVSQLGRASAARVVFLMQPLQPFLRDQRIDLRGR